MLYTIQLNEFYLLIIQYIVVYVQYFNSFYND